MNFVGHHIERSGLAYVHACEVLGWIEIVIQIGRPRGRYYSTLKLGHLQHTHPCQFDEELWGMDGKNHASPTHRKITVWALWNLYDYIYQIEDA
jgi:hypothetical protein